MLDLNNHTATTQPAVAAPNLKRAMMKNTTGFTLIELMITVAIVGILASIALPSYQSSVMRSRRVDAEGALVNFANAMERYFTANNTYCDAADTTGTTASGCGGSGNDIGKPATTVYSIPSTTTSSYTITISAVTPTTYTLSAARAGAQANDKCGTLTLTNTGAKGIPGANTGLTPADCW